MVERDEEELQELEEEGKDEVEVEKEEDAEAHEAEEEPEGLKKAVLDSTFFLLGWRPEEVSDFDILLTVPEVLEEIRSVEGRLRLEALSPRLGVSSPSREAVREVEEALRRTNDELSETDLKVVALALSEGAVVVSDDYAVQNVCKHLGIKYRSVFSKGIKRKFVWGYKCESCSTVYFKPVRRCPRCGGRVRKIRLR